jgi:hypothetical protein
VRLHAAPSVAGFVAAPIAALAAAPFVVFVVGFVAGSIEAFLPLYLKQIAEFSYDRAPLELDARAWEWVGL